MFARTDNQGCALCKYPFQNKQFLNKLLANHVRNRCTVCCSVFSVPPFKLRVLLWIQAALPPDFISHRKLKLAKFLFATLGFVFLFLLTYNISHSHNLQHKESGTLFTMRCYFIKLKFEKQQYPQSSWIY